MPQPIRPISRTKVSLPLRSAAQKMLIGLFPVLLLGLLVGLFSFGFAFRQSGYFSELANAFGVILFFPPVLLVFGLIARTLRDKFFVFYPVAVWALGESATNFDLFKYIGHAIPGIPNPDDAVYVIAVMFWYLAAYVVGRSLYYIDQARKASDEEGRGRIIAHVLIMVIGICLMATLLVAGKPLYIQQQQSRDAIHIPSNSQLKGSAPRQVNGSFYAFDITYSEATTQKDGIYQRTDAISAVALKEWWQTDVRKNCGTSTTSDIGQVSVYEYKTTMNGVLYGKASYSDNSSNPPLPENAYQWDRYCWVVGNHKYFLEIDDRLGLDYLKKYPVEATIDAVSQATVYLPDTR